MPTCRGGPQRPAYPPAPSSVWLRDQPARLMQRHLQFGGHYRFDADALLLRMARAARATRAAAIPVAKKISAEDRIHRATIESVEHCARLQDHLSRTVALAVVH
ncbi:hypothetical protein EJO70_17260 [Variovorax sp. 553]|nr:hypothetical protein EJO70_17260 [Variovorax sp. 553]RSZ40563.1 hypothetical protein EJO71_16960 [Variovorax sp. 679]